MYGSHDMRHTGFPQVDGGQWDPRKWGVTPKMEKKKEAKKGRKFGSPFPNNSSDSHAISSVHHVHEVP